MEQGGGSMNNGTSDDQSQPHWHAPSIQSARRRHIGILVALFATVALTALLTIGLSSVATPFLTQLFVTAPTSTASWVATEQAALTPTSADWYTLQVSGAGFQVDVPGVIGSSHGYFINDFSGLGSDLYYTGAPLLSPLQRREAKLWVKVLYSTKITDENICPQGGTPVMLGSGNVHIPAWQRDEGRIVAVNLVLDGMAIQISLDTRDNSQHALPAYADIWQHMLGSFEPLPDAQHLATHPCG